MINHLRGDFEVEPVCRDLDLSVSSRTRPPPSAFEVRPPARRLRDDHLVAKIRRIRTDSGAQVK
ncbi:hypothetical protein AB0G82_28760 [Streptomyces anulatus]|uniref:hypothetical protein n=1 Tax=Streptomyces TaxID=1883 RepID=UPI001B366261|nr:hypothetical protein [Streptomyces sp. C3-3]MBQ1117084.1 hypothetical protein [Streptomyces sp. C3-3]